LFQSSGKMSRNIEFRAPVKQRACLMNALDRPGCRPDLLTGEILERAVVTPCGDVYNAVMGGRQCRGGARCEFGSKRLFKAIYQGAIYQGTHAFCSLYYLAESTPARGVDREWVPNGTSATPFSHPYHPNDIRALVKNRLPAGFTE
jgi:hypothetical protein